MFEKPPPVPSARYTLSDNNDIPPLPNRKKGQELPALPNEKNRPTTSTAASIRRLDNPYDTMEFSTNVGAAGASRVPGATATRVIASSGTYEEIDKAMKGSSSAQNGPIVTVRPRPKRPAYDDTQVEEYSDTFISIRQSIVNNEEDEIDLTPSLSPPQHDYTNVALPEEQESGKLVAMKQKHPKPPKPPPFNAHQSSSNAASSRVTSTHSPQQNNNPHISPALSRRNNGSGSPKPPARTGDSPKPPARFSESPKPPGRSGDSPKNPARSSDFPKPPARSSESSSPKPTRKVGPEATTPPLVRQSYDNPYQLKAKPPVKAKPSVPLAKTRPGSYDDPEEVIRYKDKKKPKKPSREGLGVLASSNDGNNFDYDDPDEGMYNTAEAVYDDTGVNVAEVAASPKFDDGIYMSGGGIPKNRHPPAASAATSPPDPLGPLKKQNYFHGFLSRPEAEGLLVEDGEYLIRESSKKPGQYVLTGMANGKIQHLLLMDKQGRVKSKDREFDSVQHLIQYFIQSQLPLVIGNSQVFLKKPVVNAFSSA